MLSPLLHANLAVAAATAAVAALRKPVRRTFGARAAYGLWLAVPLAALAVLAPKPATPTVLTPVLAPMEATVEAVAVEAAPAGLDWSALAPPALFGLWVLGVLAAGGVLLIRQAQFVAEAKAGRAGPAVVGVLRPRIVVPADFESRFGAEERAVILSHEQAHVRQGDAGVNAVAAAIQCLCWFNPLAHLGSHLMRIDQELACDAAVLAAHPQARKLYANALLKTQLNTQPLPLGCHWPSAASHPLKERIVMLKSPLPARARRLTGAVVVALAVGGAGVAAWAAAPTKASVPEPATAPAADLAPAADVAYHILFLKDGEPMARRMLTGRYGQEVSVEIPDLMRVSVSAQAPRADATSFTTAKMSAFYKGAWRPTEVMSMDAHLTMTPSFEYSVVGTPYRFVVMPRRIVPGQAQAPAIPGTRQPGAILQPVWIEKPTAADVARLRPGGAAATEPVKTILRCRVGDDGRLAECGVARAAGAPEPPMAYAQAAVGLAKLFRMRSTEADGFPTAGRLVVIPVMWQAPAAPVRPSVIIQPDWMEKPTAEDMALFYPPAAVAQNIEGMATIGCNVSAQGLLIECQVVRETPPDAGFGGAALRMSQRFKMKPMSKDGHPVSGGIVRIPIRFALPSGPAPAT